MTTFFLANPKTGTPLTLLAEYSGQKSGQVKYFDSIPEAELYAESLELPRNMYSIKAAKSD